jgi:hypothetical protein
MRAAECLRLARFEEGVEMSWKVGPLLLAIASVAVRLRGDHGPADLLAIVYLSAVTLRLHRSSELLTAVRSVRS